MYTKERTSNRRITFFFLIYLLPRGLNVSTIYEVSAKAFLRVEKEVAKREREKRKKKGRALEEEKTVTEKEPL